MLSKEMQKALNEQLNFELFSSYLYVSMSAYMQASGLPGAALWMKYQALEELLHVDQFFSYINERQGRVLLSAIEGPQTEWDSALQTFEQALDHERIVTRRINALVAQAHAEQDFATHHFLQWFVNEQVEEEATLDDIIIKLRMVGKEGYGVFMIDRELAARPMPSPAPQAK